MEANAVLELELRKLVDSKVLEGGVHPSRSLASLECLFKIVNNILSQPDELKFRKLKVSGSTYTKNVKEIEGASDFIKIVGFVRRVIDHEEFMVLEAPSRDTLEAASRVLNIGVAKAKAKLSALQSRPDADSAEKKHHEALLQQVRADRQERYLQQMGKSTK